MKCRMILCERHIPCIDCDDTTCLHQGKKESDCPWWDCDVIGVDCETECERIDKYIESLRNGGDGK